MEISGRVKQRIRQVYFHLDSDQFRSFGSKTNHLVRSQLNLLDQISSVERQELDELFSGPALPPNETACPKVSEFEFSVQLKQKLWELIASPSP